MTWQSGFNDSNIVKAIENSGRVQAILSLAAILIAIASLAIAFTR